MVTCCLPLLAISLNAVPPRGAIKQRRLLRATVTSPGGQRSTAAKLNEANQMVPLAEQLKGN